MSLSMYQIAVPSLIHMLKNLSALLDKGLAFAEEKKMDPAVLINASLAPDMFPLVRQVQIATDNAKGCAARLAEWEIPVFEDTETTFPELKRRIQKTVDFILSVPAERFAGSEGREIILKLPRDEIKFSGKDYLLHFVLPNFYFHVTTAYDILRHNGVVIGKRDYLGKSE